MNPDVNQPPQQPSDSTIPAWFSETATPPLPQRPSNKPGIPRRFIIIVVAALALLGGAGVLAVNLIGGNKTTCLTNDDYKQLTGSTLTGPVTSTENFYTDYVLFEDTTTNYDESSDEGAHGNVLIQRIASFYKTHANKAMTITVGGTYFAATGDVLATQRINSVQKSLVAAGIPNGAIVVKAANQITAEEELDGDESTGETIISLMSDPTCK